MKDLATTLRAAPLVALLLALGPAGAGARPAAAQGLGEEPTDTSKPFALPLAREARTIAERARDHLAAGRWSEGIADLQRLIEEHSGDVLPPSWKRDPRRTSIYPAHRGAADWARETLFSQPGEVRALYRERYGNAAAKALERAAAEGSRRALVEVARRFPLTEAAGRAWWTLGDLELERGHLPDAALGYRRARAVLRSTDAGEPPALEERLASVARLDAGEPAAAAADGEREPGTRPPDGAERRGTVPRGDADRWPVPFTLEENPLSADTVIDTFQEIPLLAEDRVVFTTAYRLYAVDAYTGSLLWQAGPAPGWSSLSRRERGELAVAIAQEDLLLQPAVGGNVVVAALQIPYSQTPSDTWQGIEIMEAIPERRLFAFDAETGRRLWSHDPLLRWDLGEKRYVWDESTGSYAQRMLVAAPPVISGGRLFVPSYRMSGRIEYHVACYELETGERLWSTPLVSGQRETNMFGRAGKEFVGSPVAVAGDKVIAQTELGAVAALDVLTGEIVWESLYEQIPLPKTISYQMPERSPTWRIAPPVVAGDVVLSTPHDSHNLVAFRLDDGSVPWSMNQRAHLPRVRGNGELRVNLLLGAEDDVVYLSGESVVALQKPGGLDSPGSRFTVRWSQSLEGERTLASPRPVLGREEVVVPLRDQRLVLDRDDGSILRSKSASWSFQEYGNVLLGDGTLYTLNRDHLSGYFDWEALLERARLRLAASPADADVIRETAELMLRRGVSLNESGEPGRALSALKEAERLVEPLRTAHDDGPDAVLDERLFRILVAEASVHAELSSADEALETLDRALPLAPDREAVRDVLFREERLLRGRDPARRMEVFAALEERCGDLPLPTDVPLGDGEWLIGEALLDPQDLVGWSDAELSVGLWVLLSRAEASARAHRGEAALEDLHAALARYGEMPLAPRLRVADLVEERIARRIELDGPEVYRGFEERARKRLARAVESHDPLLLEELVRLYPQSEAAREARRTQLSWAYAADDAQTVIELAHETLSDRPEPTPDDALALLRVASILGRAGNSALEGMLLDELALGHGDLVSDLPEHEGRTLAELAAAQTVNAPAATEPEPSFDQHVRTTATYDGDHFFVGSLPLGPFEAESGPRVAHVYLGAKSVCAFSSDDPSTFLWPPYELPFTRTSAEYGLSDTRIVVGGREHLLGIDREGRRAWQLALDDRVEDLRIHRGLALVTIGSRTSPRKVVAVDAHGGLLLWELDLPDPGTGTWKPPVLGDGRAVLFLYRSSREASVLVVDLARGRPTAYFDTDSIVDTHVDESAWTVEDVLLVPTFPQRGRKSALSAYGLVSGAPLWSLPLKEPEELFAVLGCQGRDYLITQSVALEDERAGGAIYLLEDPVLGSVRQIARFSRDDEPMGIPIGKRTELDEPLVFLESHRTGSSTVSVRAVQLPYGTGWTHSLSVSSEEIYRSGMPLPAVSDSCVALAYVMSLNTDLADAAGLVFLDRTTGVPLDRREIELGPANGLELRGLGSSLFVHLRGRPPAGRLEIMENVR